MCDPQSLFCSFADAIQSSDVQCAMLVVCKINILLAVIFGKHTERITCTSVVPPVLNQCI